MEPAVVVRIHPGQLSWRRRRIRTVLIIPLIVVAASSASGQNLGASSVPVSSGQPAQHDSTRTHRHARLLQARFERLRVRALPRVPDADGQECAEVIGRLCIWGGDHDDWEPKEESAEIVAARSELLAGLDSLGALIPGDHWVFGQRVRYLVEAGRFAAAEAMGRRCTLPARWRCDAHLGFVHHNRTEFARAEQAFGRAIAAMPDELRREWTAPGFFLDRELRRWHAEQPDSAAALARLWMLADPLFLVEGNDRWTGHMSRWSYSMSAVRAGNPFEMSWGDDLTEVVVRYGWPDGWERTWPRVGQSDYRVIGRDLPGAFRTFPPREVLARDPAGGETVGWRIPEDHSRSAYRPPYLDSLGVLDAQAGRFWRPGHVVVVGAWTAPREVLAAREVEAAPVLAGLFVEQNGEIRADERAIADPGQPVRLMTRVPWADWGTLSIEAWVPEARRAYRLRAGMGFRQLPAGRMAISDLVFLETGEEPANLEELAGVLRTSSEVRSGEALGVALEVYGLGTREQTVSFSTWVERRGDGLLRRIGRWLRLAGPREVVSVSWEEAAPRSPDALFRTFTIGMPELSPGEYDAVVEVSARGRPPLTARRTFSVR